MNRTEELALLKRKLFKIELSLKRKEYKNSEEHKNLLLNKRKVLEEIETLKYEIQVDAGQVGFAFTELISKKGK